MCEQGDFLEVLYDEFGCGGSLESSSFRMLAELVHEGDYGVAADVLKALIDDGHADIAAELFRKICSGHSSSWHFDNQLCATACMLIGDLISAGAGLHAAEMLHELMDAEEMIQDVDVVVIMSKLASMGHEDWVVVLCNHLFTINAASLATVLGQMVESGLLPLTSRVLLGMVQGGTAHDMTKLTEIRSQLHKADREGCLELCQAMDSQLAKSVHLPDEIKMKISGVCGSPHSDFTESYKPVNAVLSCS